MAMTQCPECGHDISTTAQACPHCGCTLQRPKQPARSPSGCLVLIIGVVVMLALFGIFGDKKKVSKKTTTAKPATVRSYEEIRKERIENGFSAWDGSHIELTRYIKSIMKDPDSYDHMETVYRDMGDYLIVKTRFRGNNSFGGKSVEWIEAKCDLDGHLLEIRGQSP